MGNKIVIFFLCIQRTALIFILVPFSSVSSLYLFREPLGQLFGAFHFILLNFNESYSSFCRTWSTTHSPLVGMMIGVRLKLGFLKTLLIHEFVICQLLAGARIFFMVEKSSAFEKSREVVLLLSTNMPPNMVFSCQAQNN